MPPRPRAQLAEIGAAGARPAVDDAREPQGAVAEIDRGRDPLRPRRVGVEVVDEAAEIGVGRGVVDLADAVGDRRPLAGEPGERVAPDGAAGAVGEDVDPLGGGALGEQRDQVGEMGRGTDGAVDVARVAQEILRRRPGEEHDDRLAPGEMPICAACPAARSTVVLAPWT